MQRGKISLSILQRFAPRGLDRWRPLDQVLIV